MAGCLEIAIFAKKKNIKDNLNYDKDIYPISIRLANSLYRFFRENSINQSPEGIFYDFYSELEYIELNKIGPIMKEYIKLGMELFFQRINYVPKIKE